MDYKKLKKIRKETGISISLCKKALEKTNDIQKAKKLLLKWGAKTVVDKVSRSTSQGAIFCYVHHNKKVVGLLELLCETDFVAKNLEFEKLGQELAMQIATNAPLKESKLLSQEYIRDPAKKVSDLIKESILKFGENIKIGRFLKWELREK